MSASRFALVASIVAAALVAGQGVAHILWFSVLGARHDVLSANSPRGIFDWVGIGALGLSAVALLALARRGRRRGAAAAAGALLAFLAIDDALELHDDFGSSWQALYLPILVPLFVLLWALSADAEAPVRNLLRIALSLLVVALVAGRLFEPVLSWGNWGPGDWPYEAKVIAKQGAELGGWTLLAGSALWLAFATAIGTSRWASRGWREPGTSAVGTDRLAS